MQVGNKAQTYEQRSLFASHQVWGWRELVAMARALGAEEVPGWSSREQALLQGLPEVRGEQVARFQDLIRRGSDPLGDEFCRIFSPDQRREQGATYTPPTVVESMLRWAASQGSPRLVVDPGAGSGRFSVAAGRKFPQAEILACELDPVAAVLARGHLAAAGLADRAAVQCCDYRRLNLDQKRPEGEPVLFIGNPPYVRHHDIPAEWKDWLRAQARSLGLEANCLAGLHVYFMVATARLAAPGDLVALITSSEWLDVGYGKLVRALALDHLGLERLVVLEPTARVFADAMTTGAVLCSRVGSHTGTVHLRRVANCDELGDLSGGAALKRERFASARRWSRLRNSPAGMPAGYVELGELCRVHRGQVTGANHFWIAGEHSHELPGEVLYPAVTRASELYRAGLVLSSDASLRRVIDIPADLADLSDQARAKVERFLATGKQAGVHEGYIASHRRPWWRVGLRAPAPILASYMARRTPAFVLNRARARHLNISHGLYPREPLDDALLEALVRYLSENTELSRGRTYSGGLTKFEPREMERIPVPGPDLLMAGMQA